MDDLIERADATETFAELYDVFDDYPNIIKELHKTYDKILAIPSADKQGEWIEEIYLNGHTYGTCSNCLHVRIQDNYCPNCGAKMNKGTDND